MSKKSVTTPLSTKEVEDISHLELDQSKPPVDYDKKAFSMFKTSTGWHLVEIPFDTKTFQVGAPKIILTNTEQLEIEFQFQVKSSQELFD